MYLRLPMRRITQEIRLIRLRNVGDMFDVRDLDEFMERGKPGQK